jgi:shikimate dehydrogenase
VSGPRAFVIGWPIAHSRSPLIHRFWLRRYGIEGDYTAEAVPPEEIAEFLGSVAARGFAGGNVTVPHKEAAFTACAELTPVARRLGAANTLWLRDARLCGDNTDAYGFAANLDEQAPGWRNGGTAIVVGAGGSSRAVLHALIEAGFATIHLVNRTVARAESLANHFGAPVVAASLTALPDLLPRADIVVNATSAGMAGRDGVDIPWNAARKSAVATDIVYVPLVTPFLAGAAGRGLRIVDGLGMLLHQAAPGFERWFGRRPEVDAELRRLVLADLER